MSIAMTMTTTAATALAANRPAPAPPLLLTGARVIDPANARDALADVLIKAGLILAVAPAIPPTAWTPPPG